MARSATIKRKTAETSIAITIDLDGSGKSEISTGIGFFDHMLALFAKHGLFDLRVVAEGDLHVDYHHTVEDTAIVLGESVKIALGDKAGIRRYGLCYAPMDEALVRCVVDLGGRPYLAYNPPPNVGAIGVGFGFQLVEEFLRGFATNAAANLHIDVLAGRDPHHMAEAVFKSLSRAVDDASSIDPRVVGVPSTKGVL